MATVNIKKPSGITLATGAGTPEVYRISVYNENWEENRYFLWDRQEGAWYEEGDTSGNTWYTAAEPSVLMQSTTGQYIYAEGAEMALGDIESITYTPGTPGGYTDAAKRIITEAIRLIYDETRKVLLCSTAKKANIYSLAPSTETGYDVAVVFNLTALAAEATAAGKTAKATAIGNIAATDQFTIAVDWGTQPEELARQDTINAILGLLQSDSEDIPEDVPEGVNEKLVLIMQYLGVPASISYTELTKAEIIAIARDCQYGVMGTSWPIPSYLPTGVTEANVQSAAQALGITYHAPTSNA